MCLLAQTAPDNRPPLKNPIFPLFERFPSPKMVYLDPKCLRTLPDCRSSVAYFYLGIRPFRNTMRNRQSMQISVYKPYTQLYLLITSQECRSPMLSGSTGLEIFYRASPCFPSSLASFRIFSVASSFVVVHPIFLYQLRNTRIILFGLSKASSHSSSAQARVLHHERCALLFY